jgi:hypothetical protein
MLHGNLLQRVGLTVAQVVHDYGDICQVVTELAVEQSAPITAAEFRTLNLCLDDAIAGAVTEFERSRELEISDEETERLGSFSHEVRNLVAIATLSFDSIKQGTVGASGSTGALHERSLKRLRELVDRSLARVRLESGIPRLDRLSMAKFIEEIEIGAAIEARARGIHLAVGKVDPTVFVDADHLTLASALANILQNAFKFTHVGGHVTLTTRATSDRVLIEVADECGGLPPGKAEELFRPFEQRASDRSGVGLGLAICVSAMNANGGAMHVRDVPGTGCVFTLDLPRKPPPPTPVETP